MIKYCLPIIKNSRADVLKVINENIGKYDFFEVWIDYVEDYNDEFIQKISTELQQKLIIVFRRQSLEKIKKTFQEIINIINIVKDNGCFIDLDITTQQKELEYIRENLISIKSIISYHNYQITPKDEILNEIIETMKRYSPFIYKVATFCNNEDDSLRLMQLLTKFKKMKKKFIVLGMGELGLITRIFGTIWGNDMTFAPLTESEKSAPGQLTREQMENIFNIIR